MTEPHDDSVDPLTDAKSAGPANHKSIGEVLSLLTDDFPDISISKIRFLESRGLIEPHRAPSGYRKFDTADVERLQWILTMQRDHFLPLRVIKDRLDSGEALSVVEQASAADFSPKAKAPKPAVKPGVSRFRVPGETAEDLDASTLARTAGLSAQQLDELIRFGLLDPRDTPDGSRFNSEELRVAKAAASFLQHGIEARHLKAWRVAAEREVGMLEQIVIPISRKGSAAADNRAKEVADDLIEMGNVIRETIIVKSLRDRLGFDTE